jgi:hypothetical protein
MDNITIGYLSWKRHDIFKQTLSSHKNNGLFDIISPKNRLIFFQEINQSDIEIAKQFECNYIGSRENIGIMNAFIQLVEKCETEYFIFSENDFLLMENNNFNINKTLEDCISLLNEYPYGQIKLSNSKNPGFLYITPSDKNAWLSNNQSDFRYKIESLSWIEEPESFYHNIKIIYKNYKWYCVNHSDQNWSNHIYMCNTKFLKDIVLPLLKYNRDTNPSLDVKYQGLEDTLCFPEKINSNIKINELIGEFKTRHILSGGGNFFHNKVN